jgi:hypothetical protein
MPYDLGRGRKPSTIKQKFPAGSGEATENHYLSRFKATENHYLSKRER